MDFAPSTPEREQIALTVRNENRQYTIREDPGNDGQEPVAVRDEGGTLYVQSGNWAYSIAPSADGNRIVELRDFTEYSFNSNFEAPTDGWSFTLGIEKRLTDEVKEALVPGALVQLSLNDAVQATGYIDSIEVQVNRTGGVVYHIEGRDRLGQAVDADADPTLVFKDGMTLDQVLRTIFSAFGWQTDDDFDISNDANVSAKSAGIHGTPTSRKGKTLKDYKIHQLRPKPGESAFHFASRVAQRFGLWIWTTSDGSQLVVGQPDFTRPAVQRLVVASDGSTNVLESSVKFDVTDQPTFVFADGFSQSGEFGRGQVKAAAANGTVYTGDLEGLLAAFKAHPDVAISKEQSFAGPAFKNPIAMPHCRVWYLHDQDSQTLAQLQKFVLRELARTQRKSLTARYVVEGHGQMTPSGFCPWIVDTTVDVEDEISGLTERMYVLGRTFKKSRMGGTTTELELIRLNTLVF